jgi:hypothetical protein
VTTFRGTRPYYCLCSQSCPSCASGRPAPRVISTVQHDTWKHCHARVLSCEPTRLRHLDEDRTYYEVEVGGPEISPATGGWRLFSPAAFTQSCQRFGW